MPRIEARYVERGDARTVFHPFAFLGDESIRAAEAALCAADQARFWAYQDMLFANQRGQDQGAFSADRLVRMAEELGLDTEALRACLDGHAHRGDVRAAREAAERWGIRATPTVIVNGRMLEGALPFAAYQRAIEEVLAR